MWDWHNVATQGFPSNPAREKLRFWNKREAGLSIHMQRCGHRCIPRPLAISPHVCPALVALRRNLPDAAAGSLRRYFICFIVAQFSGQTKYNRTTNRPLVLFYYFFTLPDDLFLDFLGSTQPNFHRTDF